MEPNTKILVVGGNEQDLARLEAAGFDAETVSPNDMHKIDAETVVVTGGSISRRRQHSLAAATILGLAASLSGSFESAFRGAPQRKDYRSALPRPDRTEIEAWNAEVERKRQEKKGKRK